MLTVIDKVVCIMRGLPGSGKSTAARALANRIEASGRLEGGRIATIVSADHYFEKSGVYRFDPSKLSQAHAECRDAFVEAMLMGHDLIIVDNTNTQVWEFEGYLKLALVGRYDIRIVGDPPKDDAEIVKWHARCVHGVPLDKMRAMAKRWEPFDLELWRSECLSRRQASDARRMDVGRSEGI